jgi:hypothetical protein
MSTDRVDWEETGRGWGARASEWVHLWELCAFPAKGLLFPRLGVDAGLRLYPTPSWWVASRRGGAPRRYNG